MNQSDVSKNLAEISNRSDLPPDVRDQIEKVSRALATPLQTDVWIYRIVVLFLGVIILSTVIGGIVLAYVAKGDVAINLPEGIVAIGSAAVGALAGLLAPSPRSS